MAVARLSGFGDLGEACVVANPVSVVCRGAPGVIEADWFPPQTSANEIRSLWNTKSEESPHHQSC